MAKGKKTMAYSKLIGQFIEDQYTQERVANLKDFEYCNEQLTPASRVAGADIVSQNGVWAVFLTFTDLERPNSFVRKPVKVCHSQRVAEVVAVYLRQVGSMNLGRTFQANVEESGCCWN